MQEQARNKYIENYLMKKRMKSGNMEETDKLTGLELWKKLSNNELCCAWSASTIAMWS